MRKLTKIISGFLGCLFSVTAFAACDRSLGGDPIRADQTQLTIGVFDGGLGSEWIYAVKKDFEAKYADVSFEEGKKGVQLRPVPSRSFTQTGMENNIESFKEDVIFAEGANAQYFAARGNFLDISDVVKKPLNYDFVREKDISEGEKVTIESKLSETQKEYFSSVGGKYYALPTAETYYCIVYDIELFEAKNLYFRPDGNFIGSVTDERSSGPDGKSETTYDNGLPVSYEQFFKLCEKIVGLNTESEKYIPVMWGGSVQEYVSSFLLALAADYAGVEQTELNYNYNGMMTKHIESFTATGEPIVSEQPVSITAQNGYLLYKQPGRYYALKFLEQLTSKEAYYNHLNATSGGFTHKDAQGQFIMAKYRKNMQRAAMLIDGNWWQSEAKGVFNDLVAEKGEEASAKNRKFGIMPLPKFDGKAADYTLLQNTGYIGFINSKVPENKKMLAKAFLQYCYTDEALKTYTATTNICRPVRYDMGERYSELGSWGKIMVDLHQNAKFAYQDSPSKIMQNYSTDLWYSPRLWMSVVDGETHTYPSKAMIDKKVSAQKYFEGLSAYWTESVWKNKFQNV